MIDDPRRTMIVPTDPFVVQVGCSYYVSGPARTILAWPWDAEALIALGCTYAPTDPIPVEGKPAPAPPAPAPTYLAMPEPLPPVEAAAPIPKEDIPDHG